MLFVLYEHLDTDNIVLFQWFHNDEEVYRFVPGARRELQRLVFNQESVMIDLESSKVLYDNILPDISNYLLPDDWRDRAPSCVADSNPGPDREV